MDAVADLAEDYSHDELRVTHEQNLILPHVALDDLPAVYDRLASRRAGDAQRRADQRHHRLPRPRLLRAGDRALDPGRAAHRANVSATARARATSGRSRSRFPAASTPAAIITSAISAFSASSARARRPIRSRSAAPATRTPRSARSPAPASPPKRVVDAVDTIVETYLAQRTRRERAVPARRSAALAWRRSRRRSTKEAPDRTSDERARHQAVRRRDRRFAAGDALRAASLRLRCCGSRSRICFPAASRWCRRFGADSVVLLHMIAGIDKATPVVFVDTGQHFPETLDYRDALVAQPRPDQHRRRRAARPYATRARTPKNSSSPTIPIAAAKFARSRPWRRRCEAYDAWITGRKGFQTDDRARLPLFEAEGERVKVNPLVGWSAGDFSPTSNKHDLPPHPLVAKGFPSIGCLPCTSRVGPGEDARSGRWRGKAKTGMRNSRADARRGREHLMALWRDGAFAEDAWTSLGDEAAVPAAAILVSLSRWRREARGSRARRRGRRDRRGRRGAGRSAPRSPTGRWSR